MYIELKLKILMVKLMKYQMSCPKRVRIVPLFMRVKACLKGLLGNNNNNLYLEGRNQSFRLVGCPKLRRSLRLITGFMK